MLPTTKKTRKKLVAPTVYNGPTLKFKASKYRIGELLSTTYGNLNIKQGKEELAAYLKLQSTRTIDNWLSIEAGDTASINHLLIDKVCSFFNLQNECQLYSDAHNRLLNNVNA